MVKRVILQMLRQRHMIVLFESELERQLGDLIFSLALSTKFVSTTELSLTQKSKRSTILYNNPYLSFSFLWKLFAKGKTITDSP